MVLFPQENIVFFWYDKRPLCDCAVQEIQQLMSIICHPYFSLQSDQQQLAVHCKFKFEF